jgi:hypothetical protein
MYVIQLLNDVQLKLAFQPALLQRGMLVYTFALTCCAAPIGSFILLNRRTYLFNSLQCF